MKRLGTIAVIAGLLLATALFYRFQPEEGSPAPVEVVETTPAPPGLEPTEPEEAAPEPVTRAASAGPLTLEGGISHGYLARGGVEDIYAAVDISAEDVERAERPPVNLAVVVDRSGSMDGGKLESAKRAARRLVDELEARDRLAVVSYASGVSVDISSRKATKAAKASMRAAIGQMYAGGGTNISGGFERGFREVERWKSEESVSRVVLLSDGKATLGITSPMELENMARSHLRRGVSLTTMGVGLDYNEDLMAGMADEGSGNYYFIDEPDTVVSIFEQEFDGLANTVAKNTSLVLSLADGVELENLFGFSHQRDNNQVLVSLAEFQSGEDKNILLKLGVDAEAEGVRPIMDVDLSYQDVTADEAKNQRVRLASVSTDDADMTETGINVDVVSRVQQIEVAESLKEAMDAYQGGDKERAQEVLKRRRSSLREAREKYELDAPSFDEAEEELSKAATDVERRESSSRSGRRMIKSKKERGRMIQINSSKF